MQIHKVKVKIPTHGLCIDVCGQRGNRMFVATRYLPVISGDRVLFPAIYICAFAYDDASRKGRSYSGEVAEALYDAAIFKAVTQ